MLGKCIVKSYSVKISQFTVFHLLFLKSFAFYQKKSVLYREDTGGYQKGNEWDKMHKVGQTIW